MTFRCAVLLQFIPDAVVFYHFYFDYVCEGLPRIRKQKSTDEAFQSSEQRTRKNRSTVIIFQFAVFCLA